MLRLAKTFIAQSIAKNRYGRKLLYDRLPRTEYADKHPFDVAYHTETSGFVPSYLLSGDYSARSLVNNMVYPYFGCQPNCIRAALRTIVDPGRYAFYDIGCGMGRAAIIASEFSFATVVGVEISPDLCRIADRNVATIGRDFPDRPRVNIVTDDATRFVIADHDCVVFLYNPFGIAILTGLIAQLERIAARGFAVIVVYENPVYFDLLDASATFRRRYGAQVACNADEAAYQLDADEAIVVWSSPDARCAEQTGFDIETVTPGWRVEVVPRCSTGSR